MNAIVSFGLNAPAFDLNYSNGDLIHEAMRRPTASTACAFGTIDQRSFLRFLVAVSHPHRRYRVSKRRYERARREWRVGVRREAGRHDRFTTYTRDDAIVDEIRKLGGVVKSK